MKILIIINDAPYGSEKAFNALRIANQINKDYPDAIVSIFLMADSVRSHQTATTISNVCLSFRSITELRLNFAEAAWKQED